VPSPAKIAFASNRDGNFEVYAMSADGSGPARLTSDRARQAPKLSGRSSHLHVGHGAGLANGYGVPAC